jgi:hypothetical protein
LARYRASEPRPTVDCEQMRTEVRRSIERRVTPRPQRDPAMREAHAHPGQAREVRRCLSPALAAIGRDIDRRAVLRRPAAEQQHSRAATNRPDRNRFAECRQSRSSCEGGAVVSAHQHSGFGDRVPIHDECRHTDREYVAAGSADLHIAEGAVYDEPDIAGQCGWGRRGLRQRRLLPCAAAIRGVEHLAAVGRDQPVVRSHVERVADDAGRAVGERRGRNLLPPVGVAGDRARTDRD